MKAEDACSSHIDIPDIRERIKIDEAFRAPRGPPLPLGELTLRRYAPGELVRDYAGIESLIVRKMQSYYSRYTNNSLRDYYDQSQMDPVEFDCYLNKIWGRNLGERWRRTWDQNLVEEKGGAGPVIIEQVGRSLEVFNILGVSVSNDGRITTGDLRLFIDSLRLPHESRTVDPNGVLLETGPTNVRRVAVVGGLQFEQHERFDRFEVSLRPNIAVRATLKPNEIISSISVISKFKVYSTLRKTPILVLTGNAEYDPGRNYYSANLVLELLIW